MDDRYEKVIGLEIHVELATKTKIFCSCRNEFGAQPNTNVCPVCLSMPGTLPVLNRTAVKYGVMAGYALGCDIPNYSKMDRKNYTYPDLAKAYQISQYDYPLCRKGCVTLDMGSYTRDVGITRIHIEEDAGKLIHEGGISYVDYNRGGVPLIEIVTEPDIREADEVRAFLEHIRSCMEFIGVSDCKMQEGSLRCDINISVRPRGQETYNTRTELKNINSISSAVKAIEFESSRHIEAYENGEEIVQETRKWDEDKGMTSPMRGKEEAQDYRYFPDPDLVPIYLSDEELASIKNDMPELPQAKRKRYSEDFGLSSGDIDVLLSSKAVSQFFEDCVALFDEPKIIANFIMVDLIALFKEKGIGPKDNPMKPELLCDVARLVRENAVNSSVARQVFRESFETGRKASAIVDEKGLRQTDNRDEISAIVRTLVQENPEAADDYRSGNKKAIGFFVGRVMKATGGKANPKTVNEILIEELEK